MKKILLFFCFIVSVSCERDSYSDLIETKTTINLKWNKAYSDDTIDKSLIGLKWALSYVGATLPSSNSGFSNTETTITINIKKLGFNEIAQQNLLRLAEKIKATPEYQANNAVDLGRFVTQLIGASEHYYKIIGTPKTLTEVINQYTLLPQKGYVNNSGVSLEHRIIQFSEQNGFNQVFLSEEVDPVTGEIYEYETVELLPNGQLRFGIFDIEGNRKNNADASHSNAGKPAKCMWCHESTIQPLFYPNNDYAGFLSAADLGATLLGYRENHRNQKLALTNGVDFSQTQQHTLTELLYISFMEPSAERLSLEWNLSVVQVQNLLSGLPTHVYAEFPFLGTLYNREDVEVLAPFQGLSVSSHVREESAIEVNHLND
ncbi:hypothetical protein L1S35_02170 [Flavobacterium sp. AS60]|uniref:hypothetical protein n=1 Tax=Flavobacterium anseongense TaxID=2910677 RepID=UPI001F1639A6|nr:hypothetical protein [Flavobacterium sp. AS60]MCF6128460.1 hypothetical protein [Flavobacterium sp. AS60]